MDDARGSRRESRVAHPVPRERAHPTGSVWDPAPSVALLATSAPAGPPGARTGTSLSLLVEWVKHQEPAREAVGCKRLLEEIVVMGREVAFPDGADRVQRGSLSAEGGW